MSDNKFKTMRLIMDTVDFRARQRLPRPTLAEVRAALAELGVNGAERAAPSREVKTLEDLNALPERAVIRDNEERVLERWPLGWWLTGQEGVTQQIDLPARVLYTPQDES